MSAALSPDRDEHVAMVPSVILSQRDEMSCTTGTITKVKGDDTIGSTLGW